MEASRDQLSPEVLMYIDNLKKQISDIFIRYHIRTTADIKALATREDVDPATITHLRSLHEQLKKAVEANETPFTIQTIEAARGASLHFDDFFSDLQREMESGLAKLHEKYGHILAIAKAGEPKLAADLYKKSLVGPEDFEIQTLLAIYEAGSRMDLETIDPHIILERLVQWKPVFSHRDGNDKIELHDQLLLRLFQAASLSEHLHVYCMVEIFPHMKYASTKMRALDFAESFMTNPAYKNTKKTFDRQLSGFGKQIQIEYHSLQYVKYDYSNAPNEDTLNIIKTLSLDRTEGPVVQISAAAAFARMGLVEEAFAMHETFTGGGNKACSSIAMAAAFLEGPRVDVASAVLALTSCPSENWWMDSSENVLKIIRPLVEAGQSVLAKHFIESYHVKGKRADELLFQATEVWTDANLLTSWLVEEMAFGNPTVEKEFLLAAARTTRTIRAFKRDNQRIRNLKPSEIIHLLNMYPDDGDAQDGVILSLSDEYISVCLLEAARDPNMVTTIQQTRQDLENRYGKEFLDSLVYGNVSI